MGRRYTAIYFRGFRIISYSFYDIRTLYPKIFEIISGSNNTTKLEDELAKSINHRKIPQRPYS